MGPSTRLFGWDLVALALYTETASPSSVVLGSPLYDLIALFTDCRLRIEDKDREGRATSEVWENDLYIASKWSVEIGSVVDSTTTTLTWQRIDAGPGPFWIQITNADGTGIYGRVRFNAHELHAALAAQSETTLLKGIGPLFPGFLGS